jgi:sterol desaturase/sphingolipid hydroxylase (fatty acid hydroxylase superfamily)
MITSADVSDFRAEHRARHIGPRYRGWLHFATTTVGSLAAIGFAISRVRAPSIRELFAIPVFFLIANLGEYLGHRGPMHHRRRYVAALFERHTQQHHRYFTNEAMAAESPRDFQMVLFPPLMLVFFLGLLAAPVGALLGWLGNANLGWEFVATAVSYFLLYELLHFSYHQPTDGWVGRLALVRRLRTNHLVHHDPRRMTRVNFNVTFPIADRAFGTLDRTV